MKQPRKPSPRHKVTVEIGGEKHVLRSDVPPEYTRAVAAHVDTTLRALPGFATLEPHRAAILAALSITDELFRAREELRFLREEADRRAVAAAELLEAVTAPTGESPDGEWDETPEDEPIHERGEAESSREPADEGGEAADGASGDPLDRPEE